MKRITLLLLGLSGLIGTLPLQAQRTGRKPAPKETLHLHVHYLMRPPFVVTGNMPNGGPSGVEGEIFNSFISWLKTKKGIPVMASFKGHRDFDAFYETVREGDKNTIGFGNVTISEKRKEEVMFSPPYLRNISVLVTSGSVQTIHHVDSIKPRLQGMTGLSTIRSVHSTYLDELRERRLPGMNIEFVNDQNAIPRKIAQNARYFGYMDIITYWYYMKESNSYIKFHRFLNRGNEMMGFIMPLENNLESLVNEFFEAGFGFPSTKAYRDILERYLGVEIINTVEVN